MIGRRGHATSFHSNTQVRAWIVLFLFAYMSSASRLPRENALELDRSQTGAEADDAQILFSSTSPVSLSLPAAPAGS
jgi:hypothetical protein